MSVHRPNLRDVAGELHPTFRGAASRAVRLFRGTNEDPSETELYRILRECEELSSGFKQSDPDIDLLSRVVRILYGVELQD